MGGRNVYSERSWNIHLRGWRISECVGSVRERKITSRLKKSKKGFLTRRPRQDKEKGQEEVTREHADKAQKAKDNEAKWKDRAQSYMREREELHKELEKFTNGTSTPRVQAGPRNTRAAAQTTQEGRQTYREALGTRPRVEERTTDGVSPTSARVEAQNAR